MPRPVHALHVLTARKVASLKEPGRYADGGNLYLRITPAGSKSWSFLYRWHGKLTELGFGSVATVTLSEARQKAAEARKLLGAGENPKTAKGAAQDATFGACARRLLVTMRPSWRNATHARQWDYSLLVDAKLLDHLPVDAVRTQDVLGVLKGPWQDKPETAARLRARIERVLDAARAQGLIDEDRANPARWRGHLLPRRQRHHRGHHAALPYGDVPAFLQVLRERESVTTLALEFIILTAARSGEALGAQWSEIDREAALWTIPKDRTKSHREHRVPLSAGALDVLQKLEAVRTSDFVFPGLKPGRPLSPAALKRIYRQRQIENVTTHGFRSTFRDWAAETTGFSNEVCEAALAHMIANKTEAAYRRGDLLDKRRPLMDAWAAYCDGHSDNVVALRA